MKKLKNVWLNGFFRAWDMMFLFAWDEYCRNFIAVDRSNCRGVHVLCGMLGSAFIGGLFMVFFSWGLAVLLGGVPGAVISAAALMLLWLWSDHGAGVTAVSSMLAGKISGRKLSEILPSLEVRPEELTHGLAGAVMAVLIIFKLAVFYVVISSGNYYLLILILLSEAFTQASVLNTHTGGGAFFGFERPQDAKIFYICAIVLLLAGSKFNLMVALAFLGVAVLWNLWVRERFIRLPAGKSDESITLYGEIAALSGCAVAFIYSAGVLNR